MELTPEKRQELIDHLLAEHADQIYFGPGTLALVEDTTLIAFHLNAERKYKVEDLDHP